MTVTYKELPSIPDLMTEYKGAAKDLAPVVGAKRSAKNDPETGFEVKGVTIDVTHLAEYTSATDLRLGNELPYTYPYVLSFPLAMKVMSTPDFPFNAVGAVHLTNVIEQTRPLTVDDVLNIRTRAENLRKHRKGLLIDMVTEIFVEDEDGTAGDTPVWTQTSGFLAKGAKLSSSADTSVSEREEDSGNLFERPEIPEDPTPTATWPLDQAGVKIYADASGDKNPIHVSGLGAKAFGFPATIAHGMLSAAKILSGLEGQLPAAGRYSVEFAKPVVLPTKVAFFSAQEPDNAGSGAGTWSIQLRKASKLETLHAIAEVSPL